MKKKAVKAGDNSHRKRVSHDQPNLNVQCTHQAMYPRTGIGIQGVGNKERLQREENEK